MTFTTVKSVEIDYISSTSCGSFASDSCELSRDTGCTDLSLTIGFPYWCPLKNHLEFGSSVVKLLSVFEALEIVHTVVF